jgi:hypothetical protein
MAEPENPPVNDPPTPPPTPPPAPPEPPAKAENDGQIKETVNSLVDAVAGLVTTVTALADSKVRDETPVKKPWTHWGSQ